LQQAGVNPQSLSDPDWAEFDRQCRASGTDSKSAVGKYIAAETYLEQQPEEALIWLCDLYSVSPQRLLARMKGKRAA
jgi:hypothetical protein